MMETEQQTTPDQQDGLKLKLPDAPRAVDLLFANEASESKLYWDRSHYASPEDQMRALAKSKTLYIGNLAFSTHSSHVYSIFGEIGPVKSVHMGLDRIHKTPCGFCFVEYERREDALLAVSSLSGTKLDGRVIRVELDAGFQPGRQYGRGVHGGQVRDERRNTIDPARKLARQPLKWTPPQAASAEGPSEPNASGSNKDGSYYGPSETSLSGVKRDREEDDADLMAKNSRFRDET